MVERRELGQGGRALQRRGRLTALLDQVLAAHGGREAWESTTEVSAHLAHGRLRARRGSACEPFPDYRATVSMDEPRTVIEPYPGAGPSQAGRGIFEGDHVRIEDDTGATVDARTDMRRRFPGLRRRLWWDHLDALYFAGYALWNYFTTPLLLTRCEIEERGRTMEVTFPPEIPTHSRAAALPLRRGRAPHPARLHGRGVRQVGARAPRVPRPPELRRPRLPHLQARDARRPAEAHNHLD